MDAELLAREKIPFDEFLRAEIVVWLVPAAVRGSFHFYKYRFALIDRDLCVLRYDNEAGKGDHKHIGPMEMAYQFSSIEKLRIDFMNDVAGYRRGELR